ncbi:ester cyclase [Streptomyces acidiscabies]|uniref:ester cyclase n=1 Tax=Streptomyces acidiscabies TaxID=42234 RepID=UPI00073F9647|nr:ester cyclase [Streptomyces acidiscabies]GAQ57610.1 SnoaL-like polyketide cyclase [Streptomyces acidiscabies]
MTVISANNTASEMVRSATSTALRVAARELELYDTGNVDGADEVFAPDVIDHNPATDAASGIDGMRASIAAVRDGFTDTQHRILFQQELPGGWVALHWRMTAVHTGDAFGFAASGNPVDINGQDIMRIVDGKISEIYHVEELLKLTQQISAPAPQETSRVRHPDRVR